MLLNPWTPNMHIYSTSKFHIINILQFIFTKYQNSNRLTVYTIYIPSRLTPLSTNLFSQYCVLNILGTVCNQHSRGEIAGDLCDKFCGSSATLVLDSCQSWHGGKEIVFSATLDNKKVGDRQAFLFDFMVSTYLGMRTYLSYLGLICSDNLA